MISVRGPSSLANLGAIAVRDEDGLASIGEVRIRDADSLEVIFSPASTLVIGVTGDAYGAGASNFAISVATSVVTVSVSGGQAPYTYNWTRLDGPDAFWSILTPASASTQFRRTNMAPGDEESATFACTVTDSLGNTGATVPINATVANYGGLGGPLP